MKTRTLMFPLLQYMHQVRLTEQGVNTFLMRVGKLMLIKEISEDDFNYLTRLIMFKLEKAKGIVIM